MRFLRLLISALLMALLSLPALAGQGKSLVAAISMNDAQGKPLLSLTLDGGCTFDPEPVCRMALTDTRIDTPFFSGPAQGTALVRLAPEKLLLEEVNITMSGARLTLGEGHDESVDLRLTGSGSYLPASSTLRLDALTVTTNRGLILSGSLDYAATGFKARLAANLRAPDDFLVLLGPGLPESARVVLPTGPVVLDLEAEGAGDALGPLGVDLVTTASLPKSTPVRLGETRFSLPAFAVQAHVRTGSRADLAHSGSNLTVDGQARLLGAFAPGPLVFNASTLDFELSATGPSYVLHSLDLRTPGGFTFDEVNVPLEQASLSLRAEAQAEGGWQLADVLLASHGARLHGTGTLGPDGVMAGTFTGRAMPLEKIAPVVQALSDLPFADWGATGLLDLDTAISFSEKEITTTSSLGVRKLAYMSSMADYMGQDLAGKVRLKSTLRRDTLRRWVNADLSIAGGEALFGSAYLNLTDHPLRLTGNANQIGDARFKDLKAGLDWKGFGRVQATGDLWAPGPFLDWRYKATLRADDLDLGAGFDILADAKALENFKGANGLEGKGSLELTAKADGEQADLEGVLRVADASFAAADKSIEARGAFLELPFTYRLKGPVLNLSSQYLTPDRWGVLRADLFKAPAVHLENASTKLALIPNRFMISDPLLLSVLGGQVRLGTIRCDQPLSPNFALKFDASVDGLDLAQVSGKFPLEGGLSGNLGTIELSRQALSVPGGLQGTFFGGTLSVDRIFAEDPLDAHRKFGLSVTVRELDLERISRAMDVGRVTGNLDLDLHDVVVAYGEPVGMILRAETSGTGDFDKTVSLKAVNSLSVIGTGSGMGDMGVGMFASFFEEFSYARIGFHCTLDNDIFRVRGLIREGGVEYLIKKPFLTGINIVNGNPENYISFKDMRERVERVLGDGAKGS